jgi:NAD(P)-dependent dehydrogenase (short-subunit alcohol dehydrogenase family)
MFDRELFRDRNVVITGAGRGIGLEVARQFLACGANVVAHLGRKRAPALPAFLEEAERQGRALLLHADFQDPLAVAGFAESAMARHGVIHVLVNNAGTMLGRFPAEAITDEQYEAITALNQTSVVKITRALSPGMKAAGDGSIINTVSISATTGGSPGSSIYSASKGFVATYSKALARELAPDNIRVNCISPGTITTDFHARYSSKEKLEATRQTIPLKRLGTPEDCAPAYLFLAAGALSGYITGQVLEINGGQLIC